MGKRRQKMCAPVASCCEILQDGMALIPLIRRVFLASSLFFAGCGPTEKAQEIQASGSPAIDSPGTPPPTPQNATKRSGPRLTIDSSAMEPRLAIQSEEYVVHLPAAMAQILYDSFPGFAPVLRAAYDAEFVAWQDSRPEPSLLSVVLGDFNGDSKRDIAMLGNAENRESIVMLLASSATGGPAQLLVIARGGVAAKGDPGYYLNLVRPQRIKANRELEREALDLRTDAVQVVVPEKASSIFFLDGGVIREYTTSD